MNFDFGRIIDANVSRYTVGLLRLAGAGPSPLGSGTLVRCQGAFGILTCGHVVAALPKNEEFGVVMFPPRATQQQSIKIPGDVAVGSAITFYTAPDTKEGPDLAFIPLPVAEFGKFNSFSSVFDLDLAKERIERGPLHDHAIEIVAGIVGQMTPQPRITETTVVQSIEGVAKVGKVVDSYRQGDWDHLQFRPRQEPEFTPTNYEGTSGGGIWRLYVKQDAEGKPSCEPWLIGVAYWQEQTDGVLDIFGHGADSLYSQLHTAIQARYAS